MGTGRVGPGERRVLTDVGEESLEMMMMANSNVRLLDTLYATPPLALSENGVYHNRLFAKGGVSRDLTPTIYRVLNGTDTPLKMLVRFGPCVFRFA